MNYSDIGISFERYYQKDGKTLLKVEYCSPESYNVIRHYAKVGCPSSFSDDEVIAYFVDCLRKGLACSDLLQNEGLLNTQNHYKDLGISFCDQMDSYWGYSFCANDLPKEVIDKIIKVRN